MSSNTIIDHRRRNQLVGYLLGVAGLVIGVCLIVQSSNPRTRSTARQRPQIDRLQNAQSFDSGGMVSMLPLLVHNIDRDGHAIDEQRFALIRHSRI